MRKFDLAYILFANLEPLVNNLNRNVTFSSTNSIGQFEYLIQLIIMAQT